jgi:FixJ family two-component response regulator
LRAEGFAVTTFGSGEELLASDRLERIACLVLDIHLGGLSGFDIHEKLASTGHVIPTVFITAHDDALTSERALGSGAFGCLRKPFENRSLLALIHRATAWDGRTTRPDST